MLKTKKKTKKQKTKRKVHLAICMKKEMGNDVYWSYCS